MGNEVKVILSSRTLLILEEDAKKGDFIDLNNLSQYDHGNIEKLFNEAEKERINQRVEEQVKLKINEINETNNEVLNKKNNLITELQTKLESIQEKYKLELSSEIEKTRNKISEEKDQTISKLNLEVNNLTNQIKNIEELHKQTLENLKIQTENEVEIRKNNEINDYKLKIQNLENNLKMLKENEQNLINQEKAKIELELNKQINNLNLELSNKERVNLEKTNVLTQEFNKKLQEKEDKIKQLERQKSGLNSKVIGEDLEKWCLNEYQNYENAGAFALSTFFKDNEVIRNEDESKGSKADFVFKHYSCSDYKDENLLTSICLEMKSEAIDSVHKKTNASYFNQLDKNRKKKNLEYALLVSELEWNYENDVPIRKVNEYEKMYVVRPPFFISFISILVALSDKFKELKIELEKEKEEFKNKEDIIEEFNKLKKTYLEDIINRLEKKIKDINENAHKIITNTNNIINTSDEILKSFIQTMRDKIERFDITIITKKIDKLDS